MNIVAKSIVAASLAASAAVASAAIITPISAVGSSSYPGYNDFYAIDGNPLTDWASLGEGAGSSIFFDLGGSYLITGTYITDRVTSGGGNGAFVGGTTDFSTAYTVAFYSDAAGTNFVGSYSTFNLPVPVSPVSPAAFQSSFNFNFIGASVRYTVDATGAGGNPGLSEIYFEGTPVQGRVPEAASWMLMIAGFGIVGVAARRRKAVVAA